MQDPTTRLRESLIALRQRLKKLRENQFVESFKEKESFLLDLISAIELSIDEIRFVQKSHEHRIETLLFRLSNSERSRSDLVKESGRYHALLRREGYFIR